MTLRSYIIVFFLIAGMVSSGAACECECEDDCSFTTVMESRPLVALVNVIAYGDTLESGFPLSVTVEIIRLYRGEEQRRQIKIWGDPGDQCRPYAQALAVGEHYLIAPMLIFDSGNPLEDGGYEFFACDTDYLHVDMNSGKVTGEYRKGQAETTLEVMEKTLK